jgi:hypothetical protein
MVAGWEIWIRTGARRVHEGDVAQSFRAVAQRT